MLANAQFSKYPVSEVERVCGNFTMRSGSLSTLQVPSWRAFKAVPASWCRHKWASILRCRHSFPHPCLILHETVLARARLGEVSYVQTKKGVDVTITNTTKHGDSAG